MEDKTITTSGLTAENAVPVAAGNTVKFKVSYPKDYKGQRFMPDGSEQVVAVDAAEQFEKMGIGSIADKKEAVKAAKTAQDASAGSGADDIASLSARDLIARINEAETQEALNAFIIEGEERTTVLEAIKARKKAFK